MPVDVSSARKLPESGSAGSVTVRLASIDRQLSAVREILYRVEHALGEVVRIDPAKFAGHEALRSAYGGLKRSLAESRARLARPTFRIGTIATTSAGKSTLVNALIGRRLAPLSAQEMSAGLLKLVHAPEGLAVRIEPTDGAVWPTGRWPENPTVALTDERVYDLIRDNIMTRYNEIKRTQQISMPFVSVETPLLPGCAPDLLGLPAGVGFEIMDLPGLNSTDGDDANLRVIQEQIAGAFCVMVLDYNQTDAKRRHMLLDEMARLVRAMGGRDDTLLFLLNKFNQRDCADSEEEIRKRIDSLQVEIKDRLGLAELPDVVPMDARSWMHAQCAWGATPLRDGPSAPEAVRKRRLREFRHDCTTEIERLFEKHPDIEEWWDAHRKNLQELPPEELHFLLKSVIMPHTGAGEVLRRLGQRLRERCASLIIWPAVHHFIARYEQFVRTVTLLARNGQLETREAIEAAIEATKENVASIRQNLDQEGESFRDQVERIKAGLAAKGSKDSQGLRG